MGAFSYYKAHGLYNIFLLFFFQDEEEEGSWKNRKNTSCASFPVMKVIQEEEKTLIKFLSQSFGWQKKWEKLTKIVCQSIIDSIIEALEKG